MSEGEREKEGANSFRQCHLVGQAQIRGPERWRLGEQRGVPPLRCGVGCRPLSRGGSAPAAFAGGAPLGSFAFGASAEGVRGSPSTLCFLKGWG